MLAWVVVGRLAGDQGSYEVPGLLYLSPGSGSGLTHQQYQTKPISLHLAAGLGFALSGWNTEGMILNLNCTGNHPSRLNLSGELLTLGTKTPASC
jgi:hypothetical protein